jgi:hypothetical protein
MSAFRWNDPCRGHPEKRESGFVNRNSVLVLDLEELFFARRLKIVSEHI